ncbi:hypothetical protein ACR6EC_07385 [Bacillus subtilis]|uniref:Uncharacterized protein n=1 Tax=Bacillus spizizenii TaxID=96241 RepID=A0A9Q4H9L6_BACSC|nr:MULTISPECIES: hypothetical protein [Bacillus subtilis group]MCY8119554.1 hypothetical protein [Bacillus spizizenii]MUG00826.1 hypothetical protein [Bacillus tequilensis]MCY8155206.1 hypothetical protein [Bacillus spizizenii]MCY8313026.1 hypothetical protein [Bacillus spizizenii]MCY8416559.1 hypothetical protein [Bacillus spizizenii]
MATNHQEIKEIVVVEFDPTLKHYDFKNCLEGISIGDSVVVDTRNGVRAGTVVGFKNASKLADRWVIQRVDLEGHKERLEKEKERIAVKAQMEKRRKELEELEVYQSLADNDKTMADLLSNYKALA